ncbi:MAG TPA: hypothetical protein VG796_29265 [Verrucomicrobiales bacterium]|jgi:hypothetical protein|nr:hypothetical protein [Verrucomicrobiales bacterium]
MLLSVKVSSAFMRVFVSAILLAAVAGCAKSPQFNAGSVPAGTQRGSPSVKEVSTKPSGQSKPRRLSENEKKRRVLKARLEICRREVDNIIREIPFCCGTDHIEVQKKLEKIDEGVKAGPAPDVLARLEEERRVYLQFLENEKRVAAELQPKLQALKKYESECARIGAELEKLESAGSR